MRVDRGIRHTRHKSLSVCPYSTSAPCTNWPSSSRDILCISHASGTCRRHNKARNRRQVQHLPVCPACAKLLSGWDAQCGGHSWVSPGNFLVRKRAELIAHIQNTAIQYNLPEIGFNLACESNRKEVAGLFPDPEVRKTIEIDVAMIDSYDDVLKILELDIEKTAKKHDKHALLLLRSILGVGPILSLVLLYEIHDINRFETVQQFASYCRLVKCSHESAGKKKGTGGAKIGNPHLKWAFSEAVLLFIRYNPPAKKLVDELAKIHGKGKALAILAHKLARAIYHMLKNNKPFERDKFFATA